MAAASATDADIQKKIYESGMTTLKMLKGVSKAIENEAKE